ncbi:MAG: ABC transporter permease [Planctomycetes bacterium]|nr:ABC transporter permease [Planctomycetota bacterium]
MSFLETTRLALRSLALHKFRAILTTLGVVIGVAAVIAMLSISEGAKRDMLEQIRVLGVNNIIIRSVKPVAADRQQEAQANRSWLLSYGLTRRDLEHLKKLSPDIRAVAPLREVRHDVWARDKKTDIRVVGTTPDFFDILEYRVAEGRAFTVRDELGGHAVCVLGAEARRKLFRARGWHGQTVKVGAQHYRVVGVAEAKLTKSGGAFQIPNLNNLVYILYSVAMKDFGATSVKQTSGNIEAVRVEIDEAIVAMSGEEAIVPGGRLIKRAVGRAHPRNDTEVIVPLDLLRQSQRTQNTWAVVMGSIAALSLLVGGIGIMNIMLANVAERRKEIGTRRALGARRRDIRMQFLMESVVLSLLGGLAGVTLGFGGAVMIHTAVGWNTAISPVAVTLALGVAAATGIVFGTFPAVKAAAMDPIEALRTE